MIFKKLHLNFIKFKKTNYFLKFIKIGANYFFKIKLNFFSVINDN